MGLHGDRPKERMQKALADASVFTAIQLSLAPGKALNAALAAITAAVLSVSLNRDLWFAINVLFSDVSALAAGPLGLDRPCAFERESAQPYPAARGGHRSVPVKVGDNPAAAGSAEASCCVLSGRRRKIGGIACHGTVLCRTDNRPLRIRPPRAGGLNAPYVGRMIPLRAAAASITWRTTPKRDRVSWRNSATGRSTPSTSIAAGRSAAIAG